MRQYCCVAVENRLAALCFARLREQRVLALDEPSSQRVGGFGLIAESRQSYVRGVALSREPPKLRSWSCTQPRAAKATAGVAVVRKMASIPRAAASSDTRCWRAELGIRHADSRREGTAVIAKASSALLYDTAVWYLVSVCGRVGVCLVMG